MKTSKKLLIIVGSAFIVLFALALVFLKQEAKEVVAAYAEKSSLKRVETGEFHSIVLEPGFDAFVVGWLEPAVSLETEHPANPVMTNRDGVLYFSVQDTTQLEEPIELSIRVSDIKRIKSAKGTNLDLHELDIDSLSVQLVDSQSLDMVDCKITY